MNSFLLNELLQEARRNHPKELHYDSGLKTCQVMVERFEYEHKIYSNNAHAKPPRADTLQMPPSHAKQFWSSGQIQVFRGGACDCFKIHGLMGYRPWSTEPEPAARDGQENTWVRVRLTHFVSIINGLEPHKLLEGDFYLQWHFLRGSGVSISLESEDPNHRGAIEIAVPQAVAESAKT